jgi:hypothetical protein
VQHSKQPTNHVRVGGSFFESSRRGRGRPAVPGILAVGTGRLARERRCQRRSNDALAISTATWRVEALAVLAGGARLGLENAKNQRPGSEEQMFGAE